MRRKKSTFENHLKSKRAKKLAAKQHVKVRPDFKKPRRSQRQLDAAQGKAFLAIKTFAKIEDTEVAAQYDAMVGCGETYDVLASDRAESLMIEQAVWRGVRAVRSDEQTQFCLLSATLDKTSAAEPVFDLPKLRRRFPQLYAKAGVSSISGLVLVDVPDAQDASGFGIETHFMALLFGKDIKRAISVWQAARPSSSRARVAMEWIGSERSEIRDALKRIIAPPLVGSPQSRAAAETAGVANWMSKPVKRAYVLFQANSMLPMKQRLFAKGDAEPLLSSALAAATSRGKQASNGSPPMRRDALVHFWFAENRRLSVNFVPPLWLRR